MLVHSTLIVVGPQRLNRPRIPLKTYIPAGRPHRKSDENKPRSSHDRRCAIPTSGCLVSSLTPWSLEYQIAHRTFAISSSGLDHLVDLLLLPLLRDIGVCLGLISTPQRRERLIEHRIQIIRSEVVLRDVLVKPPVLDEVAYDAFLYSGVMLGLFDGLRPNETDGFIVSQWCALDVICRKGVILTYGHEAIEMGSHCVLLKKPDNEQQIH